MEILLRDRAFTVGGSIPVDMAAELLYESRRTIYLRVSRNQLHAEATKTGKRVIIDENFLLLEISMTIQKAADELGVVRNTIRNRLKAGKLTVVSDFGPQRVAIDKKYLRYIKKIERKSQAVAS